MSAQEFTILRTMGARESEPSIESVYLEKRTWNILRQRWKTH